MAISCPPSCFKKNASLDSDEEPQLARLFTYNELKKATGNFKKKLGDGGYGDVYEGKLHGKGTVAVKVLKQRSEKSLEQFINEVRLLSSLRHKNLVVFYGSTSPHKELLLVYEFVPNHTLKHHLHDQRLPFVWPLRIQIAIEIAEGLLCLHSAKSPIIHRDVKSDNILLDHAFHVKLADFGLCKLLHADETNVTTITPSTAGYEDPEYKRRLKFTLKSDIYSFGVVLVELISRKKAVDIHRGEGNIFLNEIAPNIITNKELESLVDPGIGYHSNEDARMIIDSVAELALKCLEQTGEMRPPIVEVLRILKEINNKMQHLTAFKEMIKEMDLIQHPGQQAMTAHIYTYKELKKATNSFSQMLGFGGFGSVHLGKLLNGQMVAVKVLHDRDPTRLEQYFNEATVLSRIHHKNLVTLHGFTNPHGGKLFLVYEFVPNGTLSDHLHGSLPALPWDARMEVAIDMASALDYLHSLQPPIIHRDVKTSNVLLDNAFHGKLSDLGFNRLLPWDTTEVSTIPQGTMGYLDPVCARTLRATVKSDVYSFGVVLMELISGQKAVDVDRPPENIYLGTFALEKITNNKLEEFVDPELGYHSSNEVRRMINLVADLACQCLQSMSDVRPRMAEVVNVLKGIKYGQN